MSGLFDPHIEDGKDSLAIVATIAELIEALVPA
jgi:hypothetical protein